MTVYTYDQLGVAEITNLYLYGSLTKPADLLSNALLQPGRDPVYLDAVSFMKSGPGRFATGNLAPVVDAFMSGGLFKAKTRIRSSSRRT
jgi:hypothetical protein